jgi:hypothetical protein
MKTKIDPNVQVAAQNPNAINTGIDTTVDYYKKRKAEKGGSGGGGGGGIAGMAKMVSGK